MKRSISTWTMTREWIELNSVLQDGVYGEVWSSDSAFQWEIPENPARHSRWASPSISLTSACSSFCREVTTLKSGSPFLTHSRSFSSWNCHTACDRLTDCAHSRLWATCRGCDWIADGPLGVFLSPRLFLSSRRCSGCCRLGLLGQEEALLIFTLGSLCCSLQST